MIRSIRIINWKGYDEIYLTFHDGLNFLVGPNRIGKTSILDAICFAFFGDINASAIYQNLTYKDLIRKHDRDMDISLSFSPLGKDQYIIRRMHSAHNNRKSCILSKNGNILSKQWDEASAKILDLYETSKLFFQRILLLSEGDTFAYSTQPPGEGLTKHIENSLGIDRMENLRANLSKLRRSFEVEVKKWKEKLDKMIESTPDDKKRTQELRIQLEALQKDKDQISDTVDRLNKEIGAFNSDLNSLNSLISEAKKVAEKWTEYFGELPENYEYLGAIEGYRKSFENEKTGLFDKRDSIRDELAWLSAQEESQKNILELVKPLEDTHAEILCPVCKRPLNMEMVQGIKNECLNRLNEIDMRMKEKKSQVPAVERKIREISTKLGTLQITETKVHSLIKQQPASLSLQVLESNLSKSIERINIEENKVDKFKAQLKEKNDKIISVEKELTQLQKKVAEHEKLQAMTSLIGSTKSQYISQLFRDSLESSLSEQRKKLLEPLTEELSSMWSIFLGLKVVVELAEDAQLVMIDQQTGNRLEFPQMSGGEKTALLIFTQMVLSKYFSNADFMLLDEPLEHLDAKNRWALIKFLVDTTKRGYPKQLIVTTFEETLLREYLDDSDIKINILSQDHPIIEGS